MDPHIPGVSQRAGNSRSVIHVHGMSTGMGLTVLGVAALALGISIVNMIQSSQAQADMRSRYEQSYRELSTTVAINTNATDDMRASLIARGINPNNHDITDVGGTKP